nr:MAG TPA: hypothetical protein [Caudoviricetes sp.]
MKLLNSKPFISFNCILLYVVISVTTNFIVQKLLFYHYALYVCKSNFNLNEQSEEKIISCHCQTICSILDLIIFYKSV